MKKSEYNPALHAAQFQMFFIIKNIHKNSKDYRNVFWFGVPFFDNRHASPPPIWEEMLVMIDYHTHTLLCRHATGMSMGVKSDSLIQSIKSNL